jgi:hypothetical protein
MNLVILGPHNWMKTFYGGANLGKKMYFEKYNEYYFEDNFVVHSFNHFEKHVKWIFRHKNSHTIFVSFQMEINF